MLRPQFLFSKVASPVPSPSRPYSKLGSSALSFFRSDRVRPTISLLAMGAFMGGQVLLPALLTLDMVSADTQRIAESNAKSERELFLREWARKPNWAKDNEAKARLEKGRQQARLAQEEKQTKHSLFTTQVDGSNKVVSGSETLKTKVLLAQNTGTAPFGRPPVVPVPGSKPGKIAPSADLDCDDCAVDVRALNLNRVPSERELRRAGQLGGALSPLYSAEPAEVEIRLDKLLKRAGLAGGMKANLRGNDPRRLVLEHAKKKAERVKEINLDFGRAIQQWNKHNYRPAAIMFREHIEKFPESPWVGEAQLHLGCDAKYNGRFDEAQQHYDLLLRNTRPTINLKNKQKKRDRKQQGQIAFEREHNQAVTEALAKAPNLEGAIDKIDAPTEMDDESFEIHQKAKARYADLDIAVGRWDDAAKKLQDVIATDTDWRRKTWAQSWLITLSNLGKDAKRLAACGPKALERVLVTLEKPEAAKKAGAVVPKTLAGLSLAELETLSAKSGAPMQAFKVTGFESATGARRVLSNLPLPAIVHYDGDRGFDRKKSFFADRELKRSPLMAVHPSMKKAGKLPKAVAQIMAADKGGVAKSLFQREVEKTGLSPSGHYMVLEAYDAKGHIAKVFDPQENRYYQLTSEQLTKQWTGKGLVLKGKKQFVQNDLDHIERLVKLSKFEKVQTRGGCCGTFSPVNGTGCSSENAGDGGGCGTGAGGGAPGTGGGLMTRADRGAPVWSVNRTNLNLFVKDTPLWVKTPKGPDVEIGLSYNSQDALSQHNPFGNKWMFSYGTYVVEDTQYGGGQVIVFMPDGSQDRYYPNGSGGYTTSGSNKNQLNKLSSTRYELTFPMGDKAIYDIPAGTTSLQPFLIELRDRWGYSLTFGYNSQVQLNTITDAGGGVTTLTYNTAGKVSSVWDPSGRHASFSYDTSGNLIECIDMEGHAFQFTYDAVWDEAQWNQSVYMTQMNTAQGPWNFTHYYGYPDRTLTVTDPAGKSERWWGDWWGPNYSHTNKRNVTTYASGTTTNDYEGRINGESFPDGTATSKGIDYNTGLPTSLTGPDGQTSYITYNAQNQPLSIKDPKNQTTSFAYASNGLDVVSITNANNQTVATYLYDTKHQPVSITSISGATTTISYTAWGAPQTITSNGIVTEFTYNAAGQLTSTARDGIILNSATYDQKNRIKTETNASGLTTAYEYNNLDHVTKEIYSDGSTVEYDYTCCGLAGVVKDRAGRRTYYDYDTMKRLSRVQDAAGNTLQIDYDPEGNLVRLLDGKGQITKWTYDGLNRLTKKTYHDGKGQTYAYSGGRLSATRDGRNRLTSFQYDPNGNLTKIDYPNQTDVTMTYNSQDKPMSMVDGVGTTLFNYDDAMRLTSVDGPWSNDTVSYAYNNAEGKRSSLSVQKPNGQNDVNSYTYDALGRLSGLQNGLGAFVYSYIGNTGLVSQLLMPNGTKANYSYTSSGELDVLQNLASDNSNISSYDYAYNASGVRTGLLEQIEADPVKSLTLSYDVNNQITGESVSGGATGEAYTSSYQYDSAGNRTKYDKTQGANTVSQRTSNNGLNQVTAIKTTLNGGTPQTSVFSYDDAGNLAQATSQTGSADYSFDDGNRLSSLIVRDGSGNPQAKTEFAYDGLSRLRVSKTFEWSNGAWTQNGEKRRIYDGFNVVQERDGSGDLLAAYTRGVEMGGGIGGLLARKSSMGVTSYYHYDGRGNVTGLSDATGAISGKYSYDAFGVTIASAGQATIDNPYRFATKEQIGGLLHYGYRFYSPSMGKWINRDPIAESGGMNVYGFTNNNAFNSVDSNGLLVVNLIGGVIGGGLNGIGAALAGGGANEIFAAVLAGGLVGFLMPILGTTPHGAGLVSGIGNALQYILTQAMNGKPINWCEVFKQFFIGAGAAMIGGTFNPIKPNLKPWTGSGWNKAWIAFQNSIERADAFFATLAENYGVQGIGRGFLSSIFTNFNGLGAYDPLFSCDKCEGQGCGT